MCIFKKRVKVGKKIVPDVVIKDRIGWGLKMMQIPTLWIDSKGHGIKVAVLDTGADENHEDLKEAIAVSKNFTKSASSSDKHGHGSHCAGIIGARANGVGIVGVAPECSLYVAKVLGDNGAGTDYTISKAIAWCIDKKVDIINMSLGSVRKSLVIEKEVLRAAACGIIIIAAAGNDGIQFPDTVNYPAAYDQVISVGAINEWENVASFSGRGLNLDFVAPGVDVLSTVPGGYGKKSGTSMATPFVAGLAALILAKHRDAPESKTPVRDVYEMREHLKKVCVDKGKVGRDPMYGWGLIDVSKLCD